MKHILGEEKHALSCHSLRDKLGNTLQQPGKHIIITLLLPTIIVFLVHCSWLTVLSLLLYYDKNVDSYSLVSFTIAYNMCFLCWHRLHWHIKQIIAMPFQAN